MMMTIIMAIAMKMKTAVMLIMMIMITTMMIIMVTIIMKKRKRGDTTPCNVTFVFAGNVTISGSNNYIIIGDYARITMRNDGRLLCIPRTW